MEVIEIKRDDYEERPEYMEKMNETFLSHIDLKEMFSSFYKFGAKFEIEDEVRKRMDGKEPDKETLQSLFNAIMTLSKFVFSMNDCKYFKSMAIVILECMKRINRMTILFNSYHPEYEKFMNTYCYFAYDFMRTFADNSSKKIQMMIKEDEEELELRRKTYELMKADAIKEVSLVTIEEETK